MQIKKVFRQKAAISNKRGSIIVLAVSLLNYLKKILITVRMDIWYVPVRTL